MIVVQRRLGVTVKPGLWTVDHGLDHGLDWIMDWTLHNDDIIIITGIDPWITKYTNTNCFASCSIFSCCLVEGDVKQSGQVLLVHRC